MLLTVGGTTILARIVDALCLPDIAIGANGDPARFASYGLPVLGDGPFAGQGPLAGLLAGLDWAFEIGASSLLTVPGDLPFPPPGLVASLWPPPACAVCDGRVHPLVALWPIGARVALRDSLQRPGPRHAIRFGEAIGQRRVDFSSAACDPFHNVNTPVDLELARSRADRQEARKIERNRTGLRGKGRDDSG